MIVVYSVSDGTYREHGRELFDEEVTSLQKEGRPVKRVITIIVCVLCMVELAYMYSGTSLIRTLQYKDSFLILIMTFSKVPKVALVSNITCVE